MKLIPIKELIPKGTDSNKGLISTDKRISKKLISPGTDQYLKSHKLAIVKYNIIIKRLPLKRKVYN